MTCFELQEVNNLVAGGGVSIYYSHALQLIFFSYSQGNSLYFFWDLSIYVHIHVHEHVYKFKYLLKRVILVRVHMNVILITAADEYLILFVANSALMPSHELELMDYPNEHTLHKFTWDIICLESFSFHIKGKSFSATVSKDLSKTPMLFPITLKT